MKRGYLGETQIFLITEVKSPFAAFNPAHYSRTKYENLQDFVEFGFLKVGWGQLLFFLRKHMVDKEV